MITSQSRIEDLDKLLTKHGLMMSAIATGNLWTVSLDSRGNLSHYVGSGGSLFEALKRALDKLERVPQEFSNPPMLSGRGRK